MYPLIQREFNPGEPRDERGRWTDGGGGDVAFISPNVSTLTIQEAVASLNNERHKKVAEASNAIDKALGIKGENHPVIGAWSDGAENSMMVTSPGASTAQVRAASAMKGWIADQKAVLVFHPNHDGQNVLASFDVEGKPVDLHERLLKEGLSFHTLEPVGEGRFRVHVFASDNATVDTVGKASVGFGVVPQFVRGDGEFIGTTKEDGTDREQRDDARQQYEKVIRTIADSGALGGQDIGKTWDEIRSHWSESEAGAGQQGDGGQARRSIDAAPRATLRDPKAPQMFKQMTMAEASRALPPELFRKYYKTACEFFDANKHLDRDIINDLVIVVRDWDESKHPRGETVEGTTPGSFAPGGGGGGDGDTSASAHEPKVVTSTSTYGLTPGDAEKFEKLKLEHAALNNELGNEANMRNPGGPDATRLMLQMTAVAKEINTLHADPGDATGIYRPGGPRDTVIIGAGPAGLSAAINGGVEGLDTQVIEAQLEVGGQAKYSSRIENYMGFPIGVTGQQLTQNALAQAERFGAEVTVGVRVTEMTFGDDGMKHLTLSNGEKVDTRTVILGGGLEFRPVNFPGADGPGVILGDAESLAQATKGDTAVVIGGSNGASQAALRASEHCDHVYVLSRSPIAHGMSTYQVYGLKANPKITVIENDEIKELERDEKGNPKTVVTKKGQRLAIAGVGVFAGSVPETKWVPEDVSRDYKSKNAENAKIRTNANLEVLDEFGDPIPGLFATGDMRDGSIGRILAGAAEGQIAIKHAQDHLEKIRKAAGLAPRPRKEDEKAKEKEKADAPKKKPLDTKPFNEWLDKVCALDIDNPWFGQTVDDQPPLTPTDKRKPAQKKSLATTGKEFDESKHPRVGDAHAPGHSGGEFASGGGESSGEKFDPKVIEVGGDEWNKATARKLEREYQAAKPALDKIKNNAVAGSAGQSGWKSISEDDRNAAFDAWRKENKIDDYDEAIEAWHKLGDEEKTKIAVDHGVVAAEQVLESYATGAADWESLSAEQQETAKSQWVEEHEADFDVDDNPKVAAGDHFDGLPDKDKFAYAMTGPQEDEDEEQTQFNPEEWDQLSEDQQTETEEKWKKDNYQSYYDSEVENWSSESAPDDGRTQVASDFNDGSESEWAYDAITDMREWMEKEGKKDIPFDDATLIKAIHLDYENPGYGGGSYWKKHKNEIVEIDDDVLQGAKDIVSAQGTFPGIEAPDYSKLLTDEMRDDLRTWIIDRFDDAGDKAAEKMDPPDYLGESVGEFLDSSWGEMSDKEKFKFAQDNDIVTDDDNPSKPSSPGESAGDAYKVTALPNTYDPLNETSGQDYVRTQRLARYMSITRAVELIKQRGIPVGYEPEVMAKQPKLLDDALKAVDRRLWEDWKSSSTSRNGMLLQVATAEELGGRLNKDTGTGINVGDIREEADANYGKIGGYKGVLAYVRAKWETTQYLLDKAEQNELELYRGIDLRRSDKARYEQALKEKALKQMIDVTYPSGSTNKYTKLPTVKVDRNGAASTTTDINVANRWKQGEGAVVLRAVVPRTAAISIPAYGVNIQSEHEVVVAGVAYKAWDAWAGTAPPISKVPIGPKGSGMGHDAPVQQAA